MPEIFRHDPQPSQGVPWLDGIFVGWLAAGRSSWSMLVASQEDSVAVLGPPRVGKTSGVLIPAAMTWPGSLISASTKPDVLKATRGRRLSHAVVHDGDVYVYAPTERREHIAGARCVGWSPVSGCEDATTCEVRVQKMLGPDKEDKGDNKFFRQAAATVMRGYFHAAALSKCGVRHMKSWIDSMNVQEAIEILEDCADRSHAARDYASGLKGIAKQPPETKAGTFGTVSERLAGIVGNAAALENADHGDFDVDQFLRTASTLYIISPEDTMTVIAPLVAGLIESIVSRAYRIAVEQPNGRLEPPLLLLLDEVGAIAPLQSLPQIMSQGSSQGVLCAWAAQSFNQLRARWGEEWARSIWGASSQKLIFGSLADHDLLDQVSQLFGEYDRRVSAHTGVTSAIAAALAKQHTPPHLLRQRRIQVSELHTQAPGVASLVMMTPTGPAVQVVGAPPAMTIEPFASCWRLERAVQDALDSGADLGPDHLRATATVDALLETVNAAEQKRFHNEQASLQSRLGTLADADTATRARLCREDPALAEEERHMQFFMKQSPARRAQLQVEIVHRFVTGEALHFSYIVEDLPEPPSRKPQPGHDRRRSLRREPEPYRVRPAGDGSGGR
jgi:type IV secretion system protein VirD4